MNWRIGSMLWEARKTLLYREAWIFLIASCILMIFGYALPQNFRNESPAYVILAWTATLIRTFAYHMGLIALIIVAVSTWRRNWLLVAAAIPLLLITVGPSAWQYLPKHPAAPSGRTMTVMSINLLMVNENTQPTIDQIKAVQPDIILFQEYTSHWDKALREAIGPDYGHVSRIRRNDSFGAPTGRAKVARRAQPDERTGVQLRAPQPKLLIRPVTWRLRCRFDPMMPLTGDEFDAVSLFENTENARIGETLFAGFDAPVVDGLSGEHDGLPLRFLGCEAQPKQSLL